MTKKGCLITFEGGEGAGKSTLLRNLERALKDEGHEVLVCHEPGGTLLGEHVREWVLSQKNNQNFLSPMAELLLFLAARAQNLQEHIIPALSQNKIVLCDRFNDSTVAYQGVARGLGVELVAQLCDSVCQGVSPNLTFFLDLDPIEGLKRTKKLHKKHAGAGELDRIESEALEFHQKVRNGLREQARKYPSRIYTIDSTQPVDHVFQLAWNKLDSLLQKI